MRFSHVSITLVRISRRGDFPVWMSGTLQGNENMSTEKHIKIVSITDIRYEFGNSALVK